jgi:putative acyl-CoA dehydrogenase
VTQVLSIWEGTTNILSSDALRAIRKENAAEFFLDDLHQRTKNINHPILLDEKNKTLNDLQELKEYVINMADTNEEEQLIGTR